MKIIQNTIQLNKNKTIKQERYVNLRQSKSHSSQVFQIF